MALIDSYELWLQEYKKDKYRIWIRASVSNNKEYYLSDVEDWKSLKKLCQDNRLKVVNVGLQYRSHSIQVDTLDSDGVYLIKSVIGMMGGNSKQTITIGKLFGDSIKKTMWIVPELLEEFTTIDSVENSFEEVLIYDYTQKKA